MLQWQHLSDLLHPPARPSKLLRPKATLWPGSTMEYGLRKLVKKRDTPWRWLRLDLNHLERGRMAQKVPLRGHLHVRPWLLQWREKLSDLGPRPLFQALMNRVRSLWILYREFVKEMWWKRRGDLDHVAL